MLMALLVRQVWKLPAREGGGAPMILLAMFTMYCVSSRRRQCSLRTTHWCSQ